MNHIPLDNQNEAVKRFFLSLARDAQGSVLESNGQSVVYVVPVVSLDVARKLHEEQLDRANQADPYEIR